MIYDSNHSSYQILLFKISMMFAWLNDVHNILTFFKFSHPRHDVYMNKALSYISLSIYFTIVFIMLMTNVSSVTLDGAINPGSAIQVFFTTLFLASYFIVILMIIFYSISFDTR